MEPVDKQLKQFAQRYHRSHRAIRTSFRSLCSEWVWAKRSDVYTHLIHRYPAKMLPYIPIFFLSTEEYASSEEVILDPFAGTATVLVESLFHPYSKRNSIGVEINPLARLIAKVKTTPLNLTELMNQRDALIERIRAFQGDAPIPEFTNQDMWFSKRIQTDLAKILFCIEEIENPDYKDFFFVCLSSIIRDVSLADPKIPPPIILKASNFTGDPQRKSQIERLIRKKKRARPVSYFKKAINHNLERVKTLIKEEDIASGRVTAEIVWDDARHLRHAKLESKGYLNKTNTYQIADGSIGMVITSPPYINAQKYIRTTKFELLWLGLIDEQGLAALDRSLVGTERIPASEYRDLRLVGIPSADKVIKRIYLKNPKRAAIVSRYFEDMRQVLNEVHRVLRDRGRCILVIGNNHICDIEVKSHKILSDIASQECGLDVEMVLVDSIRSRGMITKRHETGGLVADDWVLVLKKEG